MSTSRSLLLSGLFVGLTFAALGLYRSVLSPTLWARADSGLVAAVILAAWAALVVVLLDRDEGEATRG